MTKSKNSGKVYVANILLAKVLDCLENPDAELTPAERMEFERWRRYLIKRIDNLLTPKPRTPKPVAAASPVDLPTGEYRNTKPKRGRNGN